MPDKNIPLHHAAAQMSLLSPQERLALSRHALIQAMHPGAPLEPPPEIVRLLEMEQLARKQLLADAPPSLRADSDAQEQRASAQPSPSLDPMDPMDPGTHAPLLAASQTVHRLGAAGAMTSRHPVSARIDDAAYMLQTGYRIGSRLLQAWWRHHPLHTAVDLGQPLLVNYARRKPYQLLALAAATGAVLVVLKPWRWNSTRRWARTSFHKEIRALNMGNLSRMVMDSLLRNGKPARD